MNCEETIRARRSVRRYAPDRVDDNVLRCIVQAGLWAPSGLNNQPWKFKIITDARQKEGLAQFTKYASVIREAPAALCVFLDTTQVYSRDKDIMAIGACIQNMLLQATALGLGTCWLGEILNKKNEVGKFLNIGPDYELMAVVAVGVSRGKPELSSRKDLDQCLLP
ncbi:MAG: nitroreductase family protein [Candidatus Omnitrophica bacterium]|nr:nitroreductase family protein [Candidatus Omnitrophota bacterium]